MRGSLPHRLLKVVYSVAYSRASSFSPSQPQPSEPRRPPGRVTRPHYLGDTGARAARDQFLRAPPDLGSRTGPRTPRTEARARIHASATVRSFDCMERSLASRVDNEVANHFAELHSGLHQAVRQMTPRRHAPALAQPNEKPIRRHKAAHATDQNPHSSRRVSQRGDTSENRETISVLSHTAKVAQQRTGFRGNALRINNAVGGGGSGGTALAAARAAAVRRVYKQHVIRTQCRQCVGIHACAYDASA